MKLTFNCKLVIIVIILITNTSIYAQRPNYPVQAEKAAIIFSDLENFSIAFSLLSEETDTIKVLNDYYFDKATVGLKEFMGRHGLNAKMLKNSIRKYPEKYEQLPDFIAKLPSLKKKMLPVFEKFGEIVPNTMYAPTYLLVGANRGIAQASQYGQLVTVMRLLNREEKLFQIVVHELAHFQQAKTLGGPKYVSLYSKPNNMLELCLREGGAEFITKQVLPGMTQEKSLQYFNENENRLKAKFIEDLKSQNTKMWLWESVGNKEYPQLLGYVMGYKIWEHYFHSKQNRNLVINEILGIDNADACVEKSGYLSME